MNKLAGHRRADAWERAQEYTFFCHGHSICLKTFPFIALEKKCFRNLLKRYQLNGVTPRVHGNMKHCPWNAASFPDKERTVTFIKNFAEAHALPLPGWMPNSMTTASCKYHLMFLKLQYIKSMLKQLKSWKKQPRCFGYREFCRLWSEVVPYSCYATSWRPMSYLPRQRFTCT